MPGARAKEKRSWRHAERKQIAPWQPWAGEVRNPIGPHWIEPDCLLYGYWETVREYDGFLNDQARSESWAR